VNYIVVVFPLLDGFDPGPFLWKALVFGVCWYLNSTKPLRYVWSLLFLLGLIPVILFGFSAGKGDPLALFVRFYLSWMCAEVSFQSAAVDPEERIQGWWGLPLLLLLLL
jgi:hypothetical protein